MELSFVLRGDLEGYGGSGGRFRREGVYAHIWPIHAAVQQKQTQQYKAIKHQYKINKWNKILEIYPFYRWGIQSTQSLNNLPSKWVLKLGSKYCLGSVLILYYRVVVLLDTPLVFVASFLGLSIHTPVGSDIIWSNQETPSPVFKAMSMIDQNSEILSGL